MPKPIIGLVEFNVGLIPGWGGCKEMVRRHVPAADPLPALRQIMDLITHAKTSASAFEAKRMGLLAVEDSIVMHRGHLLHAARRQLLELAQRFSPPSTTNNVYAGGAAALATLLADIESQRQAGQWLEHDVVIASALAHALMWWRRRGGMAQRARLSGFRTATILAANPDTRYPGPHPPNLSNRQTLA